MDIQPTPVSSWKKATGDIVPLELPSGNVARVRAPGMQSFIKSGVIPNSLLEIVTKQLEKGKKREDVDLEKLTQELIDDPQKGLQDILSLVDAVTVECVVEPRVYPAPGQDEERVEDKLYVDEVDHEDKFFIFNFAVGGTRNLDKFRSELASSVELVQSGESVAKSTKSNRRTAKR